VQNADMGSLSLVYPPFMKREPWETKEAIEGSDNSLQRRYTFERKGLYLQVTIGMGTG
jgi:hypothetical protein